MLVSRVMLPGAALYGFDHLRFARAVESQAPASIENECVEEGKMPRHPFGFMAEQAAVAAKEVLSWAGKSK